LLISKKIKMTNATDLFLFDSPIADSRLYVKQLMPTKFNVTNSEPCNGFEIVSVGKMPNSYGVSQEHYNIRINETQDGAFYVCNNIETNTSYFRIEGCEVVRYTKNEVFDMLTGVAKKEAQKQETTGVAMTKNDYGIMLWGDRLPSEVFAKIKSGAYYTTSHQARMIAEDNGMFGIVAPSGWYITNDAVAILMGMGYKLA
jgi:hypothetical protein